MKRVVLVHTAPMNPARFQELAEEIMPEVAVEHVVDESLLQETIAAGGLTAEVARRFVERAEALRASGVDAVVLTCSSVGPAAEGVSAGPVPVLRIDTAMAEAAVQVGARIGVAATLPTTLGPTAELIHAAAARAGRAVEVRTALAEGAFQVLATDPAEHDRQVRACLEELAGWADVIVLAQASMARAVAGAATITAAGRAVPLLTSPRLGMERLARLLNETAG
jgi:Asp/Glu/hydantoin racemase